MAESQWIAVKDQVPDEGQFVLAYGPDLGFHVKGPKMDICTFDGEWRDEGGTEFVCGSLGAASVTHWMPMPDAPIAQQACTTCKDSKPVGEFNKGKTRCKVCEKKVKDYNKRKKVKAK